MQKFIITYRTKEGKIFDQKVEYKTKDELERALIFNEVPIPKYLRGRDYDFITYRTQEEFMEELLNTIKQ